MPQRPMTSFVRLVATAVCAAWLMAASTLHGQQAATPAAAPSTAKPEEGIPIPNQTVQKACGPCHSVDDKQQISRISFRRSTPEGWQETIRRMVALNGLKIEPATAREVVKYLSDHLGLAPEETQPAAWDLERRIIDYKYEANGDADGVCKLCHTLGRVITQRRTREEWDLLIAMHRGWYPLVDNQGFRRPGPAPRDPSPDGRPPDRRQPVEKAVDHLASAFPLKTPEWAAWSATMRSARLEGTWTVSGREVGKGPVYGRVTVKASPGSADEFTTEMTLVDARTGQRQTRTGQAVVYTGYQWRGRSSGSGEGSDLREVMFVDREWRSMEGRWFTGGYDELGLDVRLDRLGTDTRVLGTDVTAVRAGTTGQTIRIHGANLPASLRASDVDLGPGVTVRQVSVVSPDEATVTVDVSTAAVPGARDLVVAGALRTRAVAVYDSVDVLKVSPAWAMARVGGGSAFPKGYSQFEARAFDNGPDGRDDTADDIDLGLVPVAWSLEEFAATYDDDDVKFVGAIDARTGRFTPAIDGPNPARTGQRNNIGDVYAVATYTAEASDGKPARTLKARAHLLVTVPLYMRWEPTGQVR